MPALQADRRLSCAAAPRPARRERCAWSATTVRRRTGAVAGTVFLQAIGGQLSVVTAFRSLRRRRHGSPSGAPSPIVLIGQAASSRRVLANIGDRLQLANLRMIERGADRRRRQRLCDLSTRGNEPIARFAWTPQAARRRNPQARHPVHRHRARRLRAAGRPGAALHAPHRGDHRRRREPAALSRAARSAVRTAEPQLLRRAAGGGDRRRSSAAARRPPCSTSISIISRTSTTRSAIRSATS